MVKHLRIMNREYNVAIMVFCMESVPVDTASLSSRLLGDSHGGTVWIDGLNAITTPQCSYDV